MFAKGREQTSISPPDAYQNELRKQARIDIHTDCIRYDCLIDLDLTTVWSVGEHIVTYDPFEILTDELRSRAKARLKQERTHIVAAHMFHITKIELLENQLMAAINTNRQNYSPEALNEEAVRWSERANLRSAKRRVQDGAEAERNFRAALADIDHRLAGRLKRTGRV